MGKLMERIARLLLGGEDKDSHGTAPAIKVTVACGVCGERVTVRIEKAYELQEVYSDKAPASEKDEHAVGYILSKELVGEKCQNIIHLDMVADIHRKILKQSVTGGTIVAVEETT